MDRHSLFRGFQSKLLSRTGINIHEDEKWPLILANLKVDAIENLVTSGFADNASWGKIYDILNISETYFYRDPNQLNGVFQHLLPRHWKGRSLSNVSIWSAGCSRGEEAYTLAILTEIFKRTHHGHFSFSVLGTDLQASSVHFAKEAIYTPYSIRAGLPSDFITFLRPNEKEVHIAKEIKQRVQFQVGNLLDPPPGKFDLIFCRNVLIYLDEESKEKIVRRFVSALNEGGILILGHSEFIGSLPQNLTSHTIPNSTSYFLYSTHPQESPNQANGNRILESQTKPSPKKNENISTLKAARPSVPRISPLESARVEKEKGDFEEMVTLLKQSLYENPKEIEAYYELASHYWELGDRGLARKFQAQARTVFKNEPGLTDILKKKGSWSEAWDEFLSEDL
jgi:chemotaxis protein methyltransferase CheR